MKRKIMGMFAGFLVMMLLFTLLSRAADSMTIVRVTVKKTERGKIPHQVTGTGKVVQNREQAVSTLPGQVVKSIYVEEGTQVKKGDILFEVDMESLQEQILNQKQEMQKADLQSQDRASSRDAQSYKQTMAQNRAAEDYNVAAGKGNTAVERAAAELSRARKKLKLLEKDSGGSPGTDAVEEVLKQACEDKQKEYEGAVKYKEELEDAIDEAVRTAVDAAGSDTADTQPAEWETLRAASEEVLWDNEDLSEAGSSGMTEAVTEDYENGMTETVTEDYESGMTEGDEFIIGDDTQIIDRPVQTGPSQDLWLLEQRIRQENQPLLDEAQKEIEKKEREKQEADAALDAYRQEREAGDTARLEQMKQQLKEEIRAKEQIYQDAVQAANDGLRSAGRAIEDANAPQGNDSTGEIDAITREQEELKLSKLERLWDVGGKVTAPIDGVITKVNLITGERTPDGTAMLMSDISAGNKLVVQVDKAKEKYIARGDSVKIKANSKDRQTFEGLTVDNVQENEKDEELLDVTVQLPADSLEAGMSATMEAVRTSDTYDSCIPIQALYAENGKYFVYVLEESSSVLGTELTARKVNVTVLDKNETSAALGPGSVSSEQQVIISADKSLTDGGRARLKEE